MTASMVAACTVGHRAAVAGELEVGQHPAYGVELRPRVGGAVGHRQPPDEAVVLGPEARRAGLVGGGERATEVRGRVGAVLAGLDPRDHQALLVDAEHLRHVHATLDLAEPAQPRGLALEEVLGRVRERLHQRRLAVAEPQLGGGGDVTPGDGGGGHDRGAEQLLGPAGDQWLPGHERSGCRSRAATRRARRRCARPCPAPPRSRCRHRSTDRAPPHPVRQGRSRGRDGPGRARCPPTAEPSLTSRRFWASIASTRSCSSSHEGENCWARWRVGS